MTKGCLVFKHICRLKKIMALASTSKDDVWTNIRHDDYLRFKMFYSCIVLSPHTRLCHHPAFSMHYSGSLLNHTYNPSDMSTCTTFCHYLSIKSSVGRNKREARERNECQSLTTQIQDVEGRGSKGNLRSVNLDHIVHYFGHAFGQNSPVDQMTASCIWIVNILIVY